MTLIPSSVDALCRALGWTLVYFLWQGTLIALLLACALSFLNNRSARVRYGCCCVALILMMLVPLLTFARISHAGVMRTQIMLSSTPTQSIPTEPSSFIARSTLDRIATAIDRSTPIMLFAWVAGVIFVLIRLTVGLAVARRIKVAGIHPVHAELERRCHALAQRLSITRPVKLMHSALVQVPTVVGWLRPVILVPMGFLIGLSASQVEAILIHELAHIRRHDYLVSVLQSLAEAMLFYHPAVWWVSKRIRIEREICCDDLAVSTAGSAILYARALSLLEEQRPNNSLLVLGANGGVLTMRIKRILGFVEAPVIPRPAAGFILVGLFAAVSIAAIGHAQSHPPAQQPASPRSATPTDESHLPDAYRNWLDQDAHWIIKPEERSAFLQLSDDPERDRFIEQFWLRRNPNGAAPNAFKAEHYRRLAYANQHFAANIPGWETDRGRIYILYGAPSSEDVYPSNSLNVNSSEVWTYAPIPGVSPQFEIRFIDKCHCGIYERVGNAVN